jgi:integrase
MANKKENTHQLIHRNLTLYQREHSAVWQCRYKVGNKWIRATTKETQFDLAVNRAKELLVEAEIRKRAGIPVVTKRFKDIAMLAIDRMERDLRGDLGKSIYKDYIRIINEHFIPSLGQRLITNIDYDALEQYYDARDVKYGLAISNSNRKTQNAAFNRVFDEAIVRGYLTESSLNRSCEMTVKGKTGQRQIIGRLPSVRVLERIAMRNYGVASSIKDPLAELIKPTNDDYIFRTKEGRDLSDVLNHMFDGFLADHGLLIDPKTNQKRVFYSLRHTYATLALTHDMVPIHTLAKQMGTSVLMIERHYSHLQVIQAIEQLRGATTRKLIEADSRAADNYPSKKRAEREQRAT